MDTADAALRKIQDWLQTKQRDARSGINVYLPTDLVTFSGIFPQATIEQACKDNQIDHSVWQDIQKLFYTEGISAKLKWLDLEKDLAIGLEPVSRLQQTAHRFLDSHRKKDGGYAHDDLMEAVTALCPKPGAPSKIPQVDLPKCNAVEDAIRGHWHTVSTFVSSANTVNFSKDITDIDNLVASDTMKKLDTVARRMAVVLDEKTQNKASATESYQNMLQREWQYCRGPIVNHGLQDLWSNFQAKDLRSYWQTNSSTMKKYEKDGDNSTNVVLDHMVTMTDAWRTEEKAIRDAKHLMALYQCVSATERLLRSVRRSLQQLNDVMGKPMQVTARALFDILTDLYGNLMVGEPEALRQDVIRYYDTINNNMQWFSAVPVPITPGVRYDNTMGYESLYYDRNTTSVALQDDCISLIRYIRADEDKHLRIRADQGVFSAWSDTVVREAHLNYFTTNYPKTRFQHGWVIGEHGQNLWPTNNTSERQQLVKFDPPFAETPCVVSWLSRIDVGEHMDAWVRCDAKDVTKDGFTMVLSSQGGAVEIFQLGGAWLAYEKALDGKEIFSCTRGFGKRFQWSSGGDDIADLGDHVDVVGQSFEFPAEMSAHGHPYAISMLKAVGGSRKSLRVSTRVRNVTKQGGSVICCAWDDSAVVAEVGVLVLAWPKW